MLVDGGGIPVFRGARKPRLDIGEDVVSPYLWSRGIRSVDVVVSTHGHDDHAGGLPALIDNFRPRALWVGASPVGEELTRSGLKPKRLRAGSSFEYGGARFHVLAPADGVAGSEAQNNDSLVLLVEYGEHRFLLTGDAEKQVEWGMLDRGSVSAVDVLKVAHHGSKTSSTPEFLEAARPRVGLLSVGPDNMYFLPHPDVIGRFEQSHTTLLRTDRLGRVSVFSDGKRLSYSAEQWEAGAASRYAPF
jgi:competence protein ComEC